MNRLYRWFDFVMLFITLLGLIIVSLLLGLTYTDDWPPSYYYHSYVLPVVFSFVTFLVSFVVLFYIAYNIYMTKKLVDSERKQFSLNLFFRVYVFFTLALLSLDIGLIWFILNDSSKVAVSLFGFNIYFYSISLAYSMIFGMVAILYFYLFVENEYYKGVNVNRLIGVAVLYLILTVILVSPYNFYGAVTPSGVFDVRIVSNLLLMVLYLYVIFKAVKELNKKIRASDNKLAKNKLKLTRSGYLVVLGFFLFYAIDAIYSGEPYTFFMIVAYVFFIVGVLMVYMGTLTPKWLEGKLV